MNQWALRWATRSHVLRGAFKDDERLTLETLQAKVVNQKPTALNNNSYPKTRPQNQAPKTVTKMMTIVHVYTIRKPVSRACFCDLVFAPVMFFFVPWILVSTHAFSNWGWHNLLSQRALATRPWYVLKWKCRHSFIVVWWRCHPA